MLEESGQGHLVARGYLGLFSFFFERDRSTLLACLLASIQPRTSPKKFGKTGKRDFEISFALTPVRAFEIEGQQSFTLRGVFGEVGSWRPVGAVAGRRHQRRRRWFSSLVVREFQEMRISQESYKTSGM